MVDVIQGNKREIPANLPPVLWFDLVRQYRGGVSSSALPWYHPLMEYLEPEQLDSLRAKALVWHKYTGRFPDDINCWWEVRVARRHGIAPLRTDMVICMIEDDVLTCGECGARYSPDADGEWSLERCNLCGVRMAWGER